MNALDRLKTEFSAKGATQGTNKTYKTPQTGGGGGFDGFVGTHTSPISPDAIRAGMTALWARYGWLDHADFPEALRIALANPDAARDCLRAEGVL